MGRPKKQRAAPGADALKGPTLPVEQLAADLGSLTTSMTIEEVGQALYARLYAQPDKVAFFTSLTDEKKAMLIVYLTHIGFSPLAIGGTLLVSQDYVLRCWEQYADKLGQHVMGVRLQTLVGDLKGKADRLYEQAMREGKPQLAWKIATEFVGIMQDLNIVERAAHKTEVTHKLNLDEADENELDRLLELRAKKKVAQDRQAITLVRDSEPQVMQSDPSGHPEDE